MKVTAQTHEQAMACLACGLAGVTPPEHFPQEPGPWDRPCPSCDGGPVWVTDIREKRQREATDGR